MIEGLFQPLHLIIILVLVLIIFGAGKLPDAAGGIGRGIREFKHSMGDEAEVTETTTTTTTTTAAPAPGQPIGTVAAVTPTCPSCGAEVPAGARFCASCGNKIAA